MEKAMWRGIEKLRSKNGSAESRETEDYDYYYYFGWREREDDRPTNDNRILVWKSHKLWRWCGVRKAPDQHIYSTFRSFPLFLMLNTHCHHPEPNECRRKAHTLTCTSAIYSEYARRAHILNMNIHLLFTKQPANGNKWSNWTNLAPIIRSTILFIIIIYALIFLPMATSEQRRNSFPRGASSNRGHVCVLSLFVAANSSVSRLYISMFHSVFHFSFFFHLTFRCAIPLPSVHVLVVWMAIWIMWGVGAYERTFVE